MEVAFLSVIEDRVWLPDLSQHVDGEGEGSLGEIDLISQVQLRASLIMMIYI